MAAKNKKVDISIILPCLNEEKSIKTCLEEIREVIKKMAQGTPLKAEVIVVDNDSKDNTAKIISRLLPHFKNLHLISEKKRGYGSAYLAGLKYAKGKYFFMADADGTYSFEDIPRFIKKLKEGFDLVVGNRFSGTMEKESMPWLHKYIGNPLFSLLIKKFFKVKIGDIHCGERALSKKAFEKIILYTGGMEFASEMIIKVAQAGLKITELPVSYKERIGQSKLRSFKDGWRHLRFILLYSPLYLFFLPGVIFFSVGIVLMLIFYITNLSILGIQLSVHPMFLFAVIIILGYQLIYFGGFAKIYAITHLGDRNPFLEKFFKYITIEKAGFAGAAVTLIGSVIYGYIFIKWILTGYGSLNEIKNSIVALTFVVLGIQTFFSSFMLSMLGIKEN